MLIIIIVLFMVHISRVKVTQLQFKIEIARADGDEN